MESMVQVPCMFSSQQAMVDVPTYCNPPVMMQEPQEQQSQQPSDEAPVELPQEKWALIQYFAQRAVGVVDIETRIRDVLDRRRTLATRLVDAARRRDETLAGESTTEWLKSEMKLFELFEGYERHNKERAAIVRMLKSQR